MKNAPESNQLPRLLPRGKGALIVFDLLHGLPITWRVLQKHLGARRTLNCLLSLVWRSLFERPLKHVPPAREFDSKNESLSQHQYTQVLLLYNVLSDSKHVKSEAVMKILADVVGTSGEAFISHNVPLPTVEQWQLAEPEQRQTFAKDAVNRFFNARVTELETTATSMSFTVTHCRFHQYSQQTKPELGPLFCDADARFCNRPDTPDLVRETTLASGGPCCGFRFAWKPTGETP